MSTDYLHGIETIEIDGGLRPIQTVKSSVIGLIGTAPDADAAIFPLNTPVLLPGSPALAAQLDDAGTLKDAVDAIYDQVGASVVVVRVEEGADINETFDNILGDVTMQTGVHAFRTAEAVVKVTPRILIAPGFTSVRPTGVSQITVDAGGTGYAAETTTVTIAGDGAGAKAVPVIVGGVVTGITVTSRGYGYTEAPVVTITDTGAGADATATATIATVGNPVVAELQGIAAAMRAVILADGPNTTNAAAIAYREDFGSDRIMVIDPHVLITDGLVASAQPSSARAAGLQAKMDKERGFWWSFSNQPIAGVVGVDRPVEFRLNDPNGESNYLNGNEVTTIIHKDGFRFWGLRSTAADPLWAFLSVRRTADMVYESIEQGMIWAMDRPMSKQLIEDIGNSANAYIRNLVARGALLGGSVYLDPELNTPDQLMAGHLYLDIDLEPPAGLERLTIRAHRNAGYYEELIRQVELA